MGIDEKPNAKLLIQGDVGQLNYSETGNVEAKQVNNQNVNIDELLKVIDELLGFLKDTPIESNDIKEDAIDFIEQAKEIYVSGNTPKKSVMRRVNDILTTIRSTVDNTTFLATKIDNFFQFIDKTTI